jgi:hypothetical protein
MRPLSIIKNYKSRGYEWLGTAGAIQSAEVRIPAVRPNENMVEGDFLALLDARIRRVVEDALSSQNAMAAPPAPADIIDEETRRAIQEQVLLAHKTYLTRKEAARYLNVSERSIAEWAARPVDQNPFPERQAGGEPRARRADIDEWAAKEKQRQRLKLAG